MCSDVLPSCFAFARDRAVVFVWCVYVVDILFFYCTDNITLLGTVGLSFEEFQKR